MEKPKLISVRIKNVNYGEEGKMKVVPYNLTKSKDYRKLKKCLVCGILTKGTKSYCKPCSYTVSLENAKLRSRKI